MQPSLSTGAHIGYLDCFSGISGDMILGALLDAGLSEERLRKTLSLIPLSGWDLEISSARIKGLQVTRVQVSVTEEQPHRHWPDIRNLLHALPINPTIQEKAVTVFERLAQAEARVHGCTPEEIHFHEVGGVDAIVDVVGAVAGFHYLGLDSLVCSPLPMPRGWVRCEHGILPLPAPAVCELLKNVPVYGVELNQELVTPTGAAIIRGMSCDFGPLPPMKIEAVGYGAGSRERNDGRPNLLRLVTGISLDVAESQQVEVIETNLDDFNPEIWPHVCERIMAKGALDVNLVPCHMKKGRPGFLLNVIADPANSLAIRQTILRETSAIGLRYHHEQRMTLPRKIGTVQTRWGAVRVKILETPDGVVQTPEYEDCRRIAEEEQVPIKDVYAEVTTTCKPQI